MWSYKLSFHGPVNQSLLLEPICPLLDLNAAQSSSLLLSLFIPPNRSRQNSPSSSPSSSSPSPFPKTPPKLQTIATVHQMQRKAARSEAERISEITRRPGTANVKVKSTLATPRKKDCEHHDTDKEPERLTERERERERETIRAWSFAGCGA